MRSPLSDTSETETEPEIPLTKEQEQLSQQWKIGTLKPKAKQKASKKGSDMVKRLIVGFWVLSWYTLPIFTHPLVAPLFISPMIYVIHQESHEIRLKPFEDSSLFKW